MPWEMVGHHAIERGRRWHQHVANQIRLAHLTGLSEMALMADAILYFVRY
jgi:hypothetical protein